jgi:hypothetical protein
LRASSIQISELLAILQSAVPIKIVILDACRNDPFHPVSGSRPNSRGLSDTHGFAPITTTEADTYIIYSTAPGGLALDGTGPLSPFAAAMVEELKRDPDRDLDELFRSVRRRVIDQTEGSQIPWSASSMVDTYFIRHAPNSQVPQLVKGLNVAPELMDKFGTSNIEVGGKHFDSVAQLQAASAADQESLFTRGINRVVSAGHAIRVWYEERSLNEFEEPYQNS